jgi:hypothetical protein
MATCETNTDLLAALRDLHEAVGRSGWATCPPTFRERESRSNVMRKAQAAIALATPTEPCSEEVGR